MTYPFASGDLLDERNTYTYTPYGGEQFLEAWRDQRRMTLATLPPAQEPPESEGPRWELDGEVHAEALFHAVRRRPSSGAMAMFDLVVGRFEVTKRLWPRVTLEARPIDRHDFRHLDLYVCFAEAAEAAYSATGSLVYLNALLKCLDTCCALVGDVTIAGRLARVIVLESGHVSDLGGRE